MRKIIAGILLTLLLAAPVYAAPLKVGCTLTSTEITVSGLREGRAYAIAIYSDTAMGVWPQFVATKSVMTFPVPETFGIRSAEITRSLNFERPVASCAL